MNENRDLRSRLVVGQKRDGRREFDEDAVRELVTLSLKPGVSITRAAIDHDVNPNQLRRWIARYQQQILHDPRDPEPMLIDGVSIDIPASTVRSLENVRDLFGDAVAHTTQCKRRYLEALPQFALFHITSPLSR